MHLRKLVVACGLATLTMSNLASALGLGEVKLKSTLNQPLSAEVQLLDTKGLSEDQILVSLASPADFERNGVERLYFYSEFKFQVDLNGPSGPVIKVTSRNPVREPYLNFLIEAKWASGRLLREYTLLMDLPTFNDSPAKTAVQSAQSPSVAPSSNKIERRQAAEPVAQPKATETEETPDIIAKNDAENARVPAKKSSGAGSSASGTYGPVGERDTLWDIAKAIRPDSNASVHQTMLALHRMNPEAFIRGNINLIKKGQVLRVPDASEVNSLSKSEAATQFATLSNTPSGTSTTSTEMGAQLDASRHSGSAKRSEEAGSGRVKLEAPASADKGTGGGQGSGSNKGASKALERELATTLEELDRAKSEKSELSSRVRDLEEQVKTMQKLVDVSNEKLRTLQVNAQKTTEAAKQPESKTANVKDVAAKPVENKLSDVKPVDTKPADASSSVTSQAVPAPAASSVTSVEKKVEAKPKKTVKPVAPPPEPEKGIVDLLMDNILAVGAAAGVVVLGGAAVAMRRRKAKEEAAEQSPAPYEQEPDFAAFNNSYDDDVTPAQVSDAQDEMAPFEEEASVTEAETGDVVGEADIYIAYGKFDQAEEMLLNGLKKDPASTDIRMKLLEVYSQTQNLKEFDKHYAVILPLAAGFALSRAAELRADIPGASEFAGVSAAPVDDEFALDDLALDSLEPAPATVSTQDDEFQLDLDDAELNALDEPQALASNRLDDDFELDFDGLDDTAAADNVDDISLALDSLETGLPEADIQVSNIEKEEEFSFDFNELEEPSTALADQVDAIKTPGFDEAGDQADDFNFDLEVPSTDLAALDKEFDSLDDEVNFEALDLDALDNGPVSELASTENELASEEFALEGDDLTLDNLESDLDFDAPHEQEDAAQNLAELDGSLDDDFSLEDLDDSTLTVSETEVDFESEPSLDLDSEIASLDDELALDDELTLDFADLEDISSAAGEADLALELDEGLETQLNSVGSEAPVSIEPSELALDELDADEFSVEADDLALEDLDLELSDANFDEALDALETTSTDAGGLSDLDDEFASLDAEFDALNTNVVSESNVSEVLDELNVADQPAIAQVDADLSVPELTDEDDVFEQALSDFSAEDFNVDNLDDLATDSDDDLDFMAEADEAATKLDLARAYMDMGDNEGARDILAEVAHEGNEDQRKEAEDLLNRIDA